MGEQVTHVGADRVTGREWRRKLHRRAIDLDTEAIGHDHRSHRVVRHVADERSRQQGVIGPLLGFLHERTKRGRLCFVADRRPEQTGLVAQHAEHDVMPFAARLSEDRAHMKARVVHETRVSRQRIRHPLAYARRNILPPCFQRTGVQIHQEREADIWRNREVLFHRIEVQMMRIGKRLRGSGLVRLLERLERGSDRPIDLLRGAQSHTRRRERRVIVQDPIGLRAVMARVGVCLHRERRGDRKDEQQQHRDDGAASHAETR